MDGHNIITDPIFSEYCSPFQFFPSPKRLINVNEELKIEKLPKIDVVVVSHNHYDHLDYRSIMEISKHHDPLFVVPLRMKKWFSKNGIEKVVELDWYEKHDVNLNFKIHLLPAQHWSSRVVFDK
jgi:N-acyl-phosphatidylethanolamine-hydrolysing phospholipase D